MNTKLQNKYNIMKGIINNNEERLLVFDDCMDGDVAVGTLYASIKSLTLGRAYISYNGKTATLKDYSSSDIVSLSNTDDLVVGEYYKTSGVDWYKQSPDGVFELYKASKTRSSSGAAKKVGTAKDVNTPASKVIENYRSQYNFIMKAIDERCKLYGLEFADDASVESKLQALEKSAVVIDIKNDAMHIINSEADVVLRGKMMELWDDLSYDNDYVITQELFESFKTKADKIKADYLKKKEDRKKKMGA